MSINKKKLVELTKQILSHDLRIAPKSSGEVLGPCKIFCREGHPPIELGDEGCDTLSKVIDEVYKDNTFKDVSLSTIEKEYISIILKLLVKGYGKDNEIKKDIDSYLNKLEQSIEEWRVLIPIDHLKLVDMPEIKVGNVRLVPFDSIQENIKNDIFTIMGGPTKTTKDSIKRTYDKRIYPQFQGKLCADVTIRSETDEAYSKALREIDHVVNLLRCYIPLLFQPNLRIRIGVSGTTIPKSTRSFISICNSSNANIYSERTGPLQDYSLERKSLDHLEKNGYLEEIGDILLKDPNSRTKLEIKIVTAIRWIGMGIHDEIDCDKFLKFSIALECLLMDSNDKIKTDPIAERCAFILDDDPEERYKIYRRVKNFYGTRSKITHDGKEEIEKMDVQRIQMLVISCLFNIIERNKNRQWNTIDDIRKWIIKQRFK